MGRRGRRSPLTRSRRTNKRVVQLAAIGTAGFACAVLAFVVLTPPDERPDPTRRGPTRYLRLTEARIEERPAGATLVVRGESNLVPGAQVAVAVLSKQHELLRLWGRCDGQGFSLESPAAGEVVEGSYEIAAQFRLEDQTEAVRAELSYQPAGLAHRRALSLPLNMARAQTAKDQVRELYEAINQGPRDPAVIDALDARARELGERLWIGEQKTALVRLRQALEEARRPEPRRREFDRLVLEAHVLAGL